MDTKHPGSLRVFFATEMWERYGFYVVQTLLALYLVHHFHWNDSNIYALVGSFTALTYVSPVVGGWIADHLLGQKRTIIAGGVILLLSYLALGLITSDHVLIITLAGIAVGTGLFKPNISSLLGNEYPENSPKRESGFTIFYMGITTGIILGCTLPSQLNYYFGWSVSFISAAIGMIFGLAVFILGIQHYKIKDYSPYEYQFFKIVQAVFAVLALWLASFYILHYPSLANIVFIIIVLISVVYFVYSIKQTNGDEARKTAVIGILCIISVVFWAFYFQMFLSFTLFISREVEQTLFGIQFPAPYYVSVQSFGAIVIGYFLSRQSHHPSIAAQPGIQSGNKFLFAICSMTIAFIFITIVCYVNSSTQLLSPLYIIPVYLMISLAELLLYPVGLSAITVLSSRNKVSTMMGIFLVSLGVGGFLSGKLANLAAISTTELSVLLIRTHYATAFTKIACLLIISLVICVGLNRLIKYVMKNA